MNEGDKVIPSSKYGSMLTSEQLKWQTANIPPDSERNIFICYGNPAFRSVCVGHYDHEAERFYEDRNFFAKPIYDAMYWCDMPRVPDMEG